MTRSPVRGSPVWIALSAGLGVALILALGWFVWIRGVDATRTAAAGIDIDRPVLAPPTLPQGPKLPDLPIPKPQ